MVFFGGDISALFSESAVESDTYSDSQSGESDTQSVLVFSVFFISSDVLSEPANTLGFTGVSVVQVSWVSEGILLNTPDFS